MTDPEKFLQQKIADIYASDITFGELVAKLAEAQARIVVLESALEMFADEENWGEDYFIIWKGDHDAPYELAQAALGEERE